MPTHRFTLAAAVNNRETLERNLLASPALGSGQVVELLTKEGTSSASRAYNAVLDEAVGDIIVFVHQDVYLPAGWFESVAQSIDLLEETDPCWGVLGSFGSRMDASGGLGRVYTHGLGLHGNAITKPERVDSLDEIVLILRKSSGLRFDDGLPGFHMYGVDICMSARSVGLHSYAIPAFCVHNTNQLLRLPSDFYSCYRYVKSKWRRYLPIAASCMVISRLDREMRKKRLEELASRMIGKKRTPLQRAADPKTLLPDEFWRGIDAVGGLPHWSPVGR